MRKNMSFKKYLISCCLAAACSTTFADKSITECADLLPPGLIFELEIEGIVDTNLPKKDRFHGKIVVDDQRSSKFPDKEINKHLISFKNCIVKLM